MSQGWKTGKEGPELYTRTIEKIGLYASAHFKNGADVKECLKAGKVIIPKMPNLADNHTANEKRIWDHQVTKVLKAKRTLENNLCNLFAIVMSLCDSDTKNQNQKYDRIPRRRSRTGKYQTMGYD